MKIQSVVENAIREQLEDEIDLASYHERKNEEVVFKKSALKELQSLPSKIQQKILDAVQLLSHNPYTELLQIKKMNGGVRSFMLSKNTQNHNYGSWPDLLRGSKATEAQIERLFNSLDTKSSSDMIVGTTTSLLLNFQYTSSEFDKIFGRLISHPRRS